MKLLNRYNFRIVFITLFLLFSAEVAFGQEEGIYDTRTGRLYKNQNPLESSLFDFQLVKNAFM